MYYILRMYLQIYYHFHASFYHVEALVPTNQTELLSREDGTFKCLTLLPDTNKDFINRGVRTLPTGKTAGKGWISASHKQKKRSTRPGVNLLLFSTFERKGVRKARRNRKSIL